MQSARSGDFKATVDAISDGADVHFKNLRGITALMLAASSDCRTTLDALKFLVDSEAEMEAKDENGWTALLHACRNSRQDAVKFLVDSKASVKARATDGKTVLMLAAMEGADHLVYTLYKHGAEVVKKDEQ